ncbi:hypothetical protein [Jannaschia sp. 2305UL9-9]|uniref:hypothetical protein n=1 Tax=Jannaschia sp. 2305UL9-9 TaxID=3121638 RepID=UPI003527D071
MPSWARRRDRGLAFFGRLAVLVYTFLAGIILGGVIGVTGGAMDRRADFCSDVDSAYYISDATARAASCQE